MSHRGNTPKRKRLNAQARLVVAAAWIKTYCGKYIVRGYAKWYGVDKICAMNELKKLGVSISEESEKQIRYSIKSLAELKEKRKKKKEQESGLVWGVDYDDYFAYIAGFTSGGAAYGITHEEMREIELAEQRRIPGQDHSPEMDDVEQYNSDCCYSAADLPLAAEENELIPNKYFPLNSKCPEEFMEFKYPYSASDQPPEWP